MAHPYQNIRGDKVSSRRVATLTKSYASGGGVHSDAAQDRKLIRKEVGQMVAEGKMARPRRASGGRVSKKPTTVVNVITQAPQQPPAPPMPPPMPPAAAMPPPPPGPPPGGPPMGIAGPGPMGPGGPEMPMRKSGGRVNAGTKVFAEGKREGTKVSHDPGKNDTNDMKRPGMKMTPKVVTFKSGGRVKSFTAYPKMTAGAATGEGRLEKGNAYGAK